MTTRRVLICLHDFHRGGTEQVAIRLARSWVQAGRDVTILCGTAEGGLRDLVDPRVKVVTLDPPLRRSRLSRFRLGAAMGRHLDALRPDVIFLPGNFHLFLAPALRKACRQAVIALKISNPPVPDGIAGLFARPVFRILTRAVDGFAAMNAGLAREVSRLLPGRSVARLHDPVHVSGDPGKHVTHDGVLRILWIGRLEPQKDAALALRTIQALQASRPAHLTMLGDGSQRMEIEGRIRAMGLDGMITLRGHVPDIGAYLGMTDVLLVTSRYEGGPAVAVEALAHGVPVVSTDCSAMLHEILAIPEAGRIVASRRPDVLASAVLELGAQPPPAAGTLQARVAAFEPQACARAYLDWFDMLAAGRIHGR